MQRAIYLIGNAQFKDVITLPLLQIVFLQPDLSQWRAALGDALSGENPQAINGALDNFALVLSSQNAVLALQNMGVSLQGKRGFVVGKTTRHAFVKAGGIVLGMPENATGNCLAALICAAKPTQPILYCKARESFRDIVGILRSEGIGASEIVVYESVPNPQNFAPPPCDSVIIFGAPSSYKNFVARFGWQPSYRAVAIGKSTFESLDIEAQKNAQIASKPSFQACVALAKTLAGAGA